MRICEVLDNLNNEKLFERFEKANKLIYRDIISIESLYIEDDFISENEEYH